MSHQPVADTKPKVKKADQKHGEDRDTTHPKMVTEFFMAVLRPLCIDVDAPQIQKNTREEVLWHDCQSPWRRSALWLLIRVTLQLIFRRLSGEERADDLYKQFMAYLMSSIIDTLSKKKMPSENIYAMNAKVARRLLKLGLSKEPAWLQSVQQILGRSSDIIQDRWKQAMDQQKSDRAAMAMSSLKSLDFGQDTYCELPRLDRYLEGIERRSLGHSPMSTDYLAKSNFRKHLATECPAHLDFIDTEYRVYNLAAFEDWVASNLDAWLDNHREEETTCSRLGELMTHYNQAVSSSYQHNPEAMSVMLLTLLELWIACDKSANCIHSNLHEYDPCIPADIFQSLLLPFQSQMARLARAEEYLCQRQQNIKRPGPGIFKDFGTAGCFSARYFDQSDGLQCLYKGIESQANQERRQKKLEFQEKKEQYENLQRLIRETSCRCDEIIVDSRGVRKYPYCERCNYVSRADSIDISIHEWPLPTNPLQAKSVVFELSVPPSFGSWRDTTVFFLLNTLHVEYVTKNHPRAEHRLQTYRALSPFFIPAVRGQRIGLLSQDKPHEGTHRRKKLVNNVREDDVCLRNGLHFQYFDNAIECFMDRFERTLETEKVCTYHLPHQSSSLQQFLFRPAKEPNGPSPNMVIATQYTAPNSMKLEEFRSLAIMPLGVGIQWQNILVELCTSSVDFKKAETAIFFLQIINQAGPPRDGTHLGQGHIILKDPVFATAVLGRVAEVFGRIKKNWELVQGLSCLIFLVLRVLSLSDSSDVHDSCLKCLRDLRKTAFHWVSLVREKASQTVDDTRKTKLVAKNVHIALACTETFNAEDLFEIFATPSDISVFIQCCMMIHDWKNSLSMESDAVLPILYHRWQNLSYRSHQILSDYIVSQKNPGLDLAVQEAWAAYRTHSTWSMAPGELGCWLMTRTACQSAHEKSMLVHFNLLTGQLLVNGIPLARLPSDYEDHSTYKRLFGRSQLEVMPSDSPGMNFSCRKQYMGHTIHLGKEHLPDSTNSDLVIKAVKDDQAWELVPPRLLVGSFPDAFVENYVHWYSVDDGYVEFRPATDPWPSSCHNWRLQRDQSRKLWYLERQGTRLISVSSRTAEMISSVFQPVEEDFKLHCSLPETKSVLDIHLPRLQLGFSLRPQCSSIQSRQYPNMVVDADQSLDSLVGLRNKLLLVHINTKGRVLLIPEGEISWGKVYDHVHVEIEWQAETKLHAYSIDYELGQLFDNGSLQSKLLLSYLNALTSFCLPDPLTKKTGTEQALYIIRSAAVRSFDKLLPEHTEMLAKIAALTPERSYYPTNERVMQKIRWQDNLCFLSQHNDFSVEVKAIFDQDRRMRFLHPGTELEYPSLPYVEGSLLKRDQIRASLFRTSGFGAEYHTQEYDCRYDALDRIRDTAEGKRVFALSKMLYNEIPRIRNLDPENLTQHLWMFLERCPQVHGPGVPVDTERIGYDAQWILEPAKFIAESWCSLNRLLSSRNPRFNKFQLMTWLSTMAFSKDADMTALEVTASFFLVPGMSSVPQPACPSFSPGKGYRLDQGSLQQDIQSAYRQQTPEENLRPEPHEKFAHFTARKKEISKRNRALVLERTMSRLVDQWPTPSPLYGPDSQKNPKIDDYLNVQSAMVNVRKKFATWYNNKELRRYVANIADLLRRQQPQPTNLKLPPYRITGYKKPAQQRRGFICIDDLLVIPPNFDIPRPELPELLHISPLDHSAAPFTLALVEKLGLHAKSNYEQWYIGQLRSSVASLQDTQQKARVRLDTSRIEEVILDYLPLCQEYASKGYSAIISQMSASTKMTANVSATLASVSQWPRLSPNFLLEQLSRHRWHRLSLDWKRCITAWGCSITALQRAKRLASLIKNHDELLRELQNPGHTAWDPLEFPESLLLEIENGILIRDVQEDIAKQMRTFEGPNENAVMQLNMGEGKSSVIVPLVAIALANQSCLVRVIVAKPQSRQMFQMLVSKLGGLLGRRVYHMPISRALQFEKAEADEIHHMCQECMLQGGVLLIQPEQVLSLKLKCLECFIVGKHAAGHSLLKTLHFFQTCSRDVVDESDENFNVKLELIYTIGAECPVELSPHRWILIQQLLSLVRRYAPDVKKEFPRSIEVEEKQLARFPKIRLLDDDAKRALFRRIAKYIGDNGIESLPISRQHQQAREAILTYVIKPDLTADEIAAVEDHSPAGFWTESTKAPLLLLRGLLAGGVLAFCLGQKRWRVNYGPDPSRNPPTKLCVPYRAKDNPSPRSEFSHPDVVITLTSLNYYYAGLDDEDLFLSFNHLAKSDQADMEYQAWVNDAPALPFTYRQLVGVNIDDRQHCTERIFPTLRFSKAAIDYFLCQVVFPREMKEFPDKLSASGWDIGEIKTNPTVGFSGTNDSRKTLPLGVRQLDLPEQNHTNALVLEYLLQPENSVEFIADKDDPSKLDAELLLDLALNLDPPIQVILDVGAQILELSNLEMAKRWLERLPKEGSTQAVVFVNDNDDICVLDRNGRVEPLQISPFARQMDACFVFLDEAHTRGIDLKLPVNYRAAVTLGPGITKDKLVQGKEKLETLSDPGSKP